jgi:lambda repressor-like predicted transcriptional regulator
VANDLLIAAIRDAGMTRDQVAEVAQADPKTVDRWIAGRIPHPRYRAVLAQALGVSEVEIWPEATRPRGRTGLDEIVGAWARRDEQDTPDWRALLRSAERHVDLIGYSLMTVIETRGALHALTEKAGTGVPVRIAVADPDTEHVLTADLAGRQPGRLKSRIRTATDQLQKVAGQPGIEVRQHTVATSHTILRFDEHMLLTIHLHGTPGFQAPTLHLRRQRDYGIFDQLTGHVEDIWKTARPLAARTTQPGPPAPAPQAPQKSPADELLDRLETTWRPGS